MSTTYYHTIDGSILGQTTAGVRTDYMTDALGSVTGTTVSGTVENTYRYMPFGTLLAKTGTSSDPTFLWIGSQGYRATQRSYSDYYVRLRHVAAISGTWTSLDKFWPFESGWAYASNNPTVSIDPTGALTATPVNADSWQVYCCGGFKTFIDWRNTPLQSGWIIQYIQWQDTYYTACPPTGSQVTAQPLNYFEAWQVNADGSVPSCSGSNFNDAWSFYPVFLTGADGSRLDSPIGTHSVTGTAIFVPGTPVGFGVFKPGTVGRAGCAPSTITWDEWNAT
jgi:hypothetical protein